MSKVKLDERLIAVTHPEALKSSVILGKNFRITVLTDRLFRVETSVTGKFIDDATQSVWFRNLETPKYKAENTENTVKITTDAVTLVFDKKKRKIENRNEVGCGHSRNEQGQPERHDANA